MRAEKKEKLMKPIRLEVKMELAYDLISEVNALLPLMGRHVFVGAGWGGDVA